MLTIVKEWDTITIAIVNAIADGTFQNPLPLTDANGNPYTVSTADNVRNDTGMLKYVAKQCARTLVFQIVTDDDLLAQA